MVTDDITHAPKHKLSQSKTPTVGHLLNQRVANSTLPLIQP